MKRSLRQSKIISYKNVGDKLCVVESTCHLCKRIITLDNFYPCKNVIISKKSEKFKKKYKTKKYCNKIFCMNCYEKYFPSYIINNSKINENLFCPSCEGLCFCNVCNKINLKKNLRIRNKENNYSNEFNFESLRNKIRDLFPNIDLELDDLNNQKNGKSIALIEENELKLIKEYNLQLNQEYTK